MTSETPPREGLAGSARRLGGSLLGVFHTRLEILFTELAEERMRLTRIVMVMLAALFCLQAGILLAVLFAVLAVGQENVLLAIGIAAALLLLAAVGAGLWLRSWLNSRPPMFETTVAELRKDRDRLAGKS
jgi:uncharacterized membrane protein YqjE